LKEEFFASKDEKFCLTLITDISVASRLESNRVQVLTTCAKPFSTVVATLRSDPIVIGQGIANSEGVASFEATLPNGIPAGIHTITADAISTDSRPMRAVSAFELDDQGMVLAYAPPAVVSQPVESLQAEIKRALATGKPLYDPKDHPGTVAAIAVVAVTFLGAAGVRKISRIPEPIEAELAEIKTEALKRVRKEKTGRGDLSRTWRFPGTAKTDLWIGNLIVRTGRLSAMLPRLLVDGSWSRAIFGAAGFSLWGVGFALGVISSMQVDFYALPPTQALILMIVALGILDAAAGAMAWVAIATLALLSGHVTNWSDVRTLLGMFVLFSSISLLAHALRPLRRRLNGTSMALFDRFADYVLPPVLLALVATTMFRALNGLSGLELVSESQFESLRITVGVFFLVRVILEDIVLYLYPQRSLTCQPGRPEEQSQVSVWIGIVLKLFVFVLVAAPFFGLGKSTFIALALTASVLILNVFQDALPNSKFVYRWYPRGIANFLVTLALAIYVSNFVLGSNPTNQQAIDSYALVLLPGVVFALIELFGREGGKLPDDWPKRVIEVFVWLATIGVVLGAIQL
jgi:hypothetical protein